MDYLQRPLSLRLFFGPNFGKMNNGKSDASRELLEVKKKLHFMINYISSFLGGHLNCSYASRNQCSTSIAFDFP